MSATGALYSSEDFSRRGQEIYNRDIHPQLLREDEGRFVAIDIESGAFEIDPNDLAATERLLSKHPNAQIWLARAGQRAACRIGVSVAAGDRE